MCGAGLSLSPPPVWLACSPGRLAAGAVSLFVAGPAVGGWVWASSGGANQNIAKVAQIRGLIEVVLLRTHFGAPLLVTSVNQSRHRLSLGLSANYSKCEN